MPRNLRSLRLTLQDALVVIGGGIAAVIVLVAIRSSHDTTIISRFGGGETSAGTAYTAFAILSVEDCQSQLATLSVLDRPSIRNQVEIAGIWYIGKSADTALVRAAASDNDLELPIHKVKSDALRSLALIGITRTPVLLVFEHDKTLRMALQFPDTPNERLAFIQMLTDLPELVR